MDVIKVTSNYRIVIPKGARERLGIAIGDKLIVRVEGEKLIITKAPISLTEYAKGLHKEVWRGIDVEKYLHGEREAWLK
ncbi:MAG: AbrB/MazE/SpoVT family DNA-binding domain-containing protein [Candidatus Bathyarchaeia archaeon]